jgi:hypothetical protein
MADVGSSPVLRHPATRNGQSPNRRALRLACATTIVAASVVTGCSRSEASAQDAAARRGSVHDVSAASTLTLEFDVPPDFAKRTSNGTYHLRALQIGYFGPDGSLLRAIEIPREAIRVSDSAARVTVPIFPISGGASRVSIKMRGLSSGRPGEWSKAVGPITLPAIPVPSRAEREARARAIPVRALQQRPELRAAMTPLLGADVTEADALASFRGLQELGAAVVLSRTHGLPFSQLCRTVKGPPMLSLIEAVRKLRPSLDASKVVQAARLEARSLVTAPRDSTRRPR